MPCSLISAPPTLDTVTATHAIPPTLSINESDYKVKELFKYSIFKMYILFTLSHHNVNYYPFK